MDAVIHDGHVQTRHRVRGGEIKGRTSNENPERIGNRCRIFWGSIRGWRMRLGLRPVLWPPLVEGWEFTYFTEQVTFSPWGIARGGMLCVCLSDRKIMIDGPDRVALDAYGGRKGESRVRRKKKMLMEEKG